MIDLLSNFDAFTMAVLVAALYFSLSSVLVYTYLYRRTYPGFGSMTLGLVCWSVGLFLNYFRPFDLLLSLYSGGVLMLLSDYAAVVTGAALDINGGHWIPT